MILTGVDGGAKLGKVTKSIVTIVNDDGKSMMPTTVILREYFYNAGLVTTTKLQSAYPVQFLEFRKS